MPFVQTWPPGSNGHKCCTIRDYHYRHDEVLCHAFPPSSPHNCGNSRSRRCGPDRHSQRPNGRQPTSLSRPSDALRPPYDRVAHFHILFLRQRTPIKPPVRQRGLEPHITSPHGQSCDGLGEETVSRFRPNSNRVPSDVEPISAVRMTWNFKSPST